MPHPGCCPQCGSKRLWNLRRLRLLVAVLSTIVVVVQLVIVATDGLRSSDVLMACFFAAMAGLFGLLAWKQRPWSCRNCRIHF